MAPEVHHPPGQAAAAAARAMALQMLEERGRGAVLVGVARVDAALENLFQAVMVSPLSKRDGLFQPDRPLGSFGAKFALAARLGLIDAAVERSLHTLRRVRNAFAHSSASASLEDPAQAARLQQSYADARANSLWAPLEAVLRQQAGAEGPPADAALRDYTLLITILVAFMESAALQLCPLQPPVVMGFGGITPTPSNP